MRQNTYGNSVSSPGTECQLSVPAHNPGAHPTLFQRLVANTLGPQPAFHSAPPPSFSCPGSGERLLAVCGSAASLRINRHPLCAHTPEFSRTKAYEVHEGFLLCWKRGMKATEKLWGQLSSPHRTQSRPPSKYSTPQHVMTWWYPLAEASNAAPKPIRRQCMHPPHIQCKQRRC